MPNVSSRPPLSEGAANAIASDIKSGEARGQVSEVPLAFQTARQQAGNADPASRIGNPDVGKSKKLAIVTLIIIALVVAVWAMA